MKEIKHEDLNIYTKQCNVFSYRSGFADTKAAALSIQVSHDGLIGRQLFGRRAVHDPMLKASASASALSKRHDKFTTQLKNLLLLQCELSDTDEGGLSFLIHFPILLIC